MFFFCLHRPLQKQKNDCWKGWLSTPEMPSLCVSVETTHYCVCWTIDKWQKLQFLSFSFCLFTAWLLCERKTVDLERVRERDWLTLFKNIYSFGWVLVFGCIYLIWHVKQNWVLLLDSFSVTIARKKNYSFYCVYSHALKKQNTWVFNQVTEIFFNDKNKKKNTFTRKI